jgi:hypothetical protein
MVVDFELALLIAFAALIGAIGVRFMWISHRPPTFWRTKQRAVDQTSGANDDAARCASGGSFIPMPDCLQTHDEMVAWMTKELPKLTAELLRDPAL